MKAKRSPPGFASSGAGIGPLALAQAPDGTIIVSGGQYRNELYRFNPITGGTANNASLWTTLDEPVSSLAFDSQGALWAATLGGPLLRLDPVTGQVLGRFGDGLDIALAIQPHTDLIYVSSGNGVEIFDPKTSTFSHYSRDENLRVVSLAFAPDGTLWATTWPDRRQRRSSSTTMRGPTSCSRSIRTSIPSPSAAEYAA